MDKSGIEHSREIDTLGVSNSNREFFNNSNMNRSYQRKLIEFRETKKTADRKKNRETYCKNSIQKLMDDTVIKQVTTE